MKKLIGFTEEITTCDCCGKSELKGTFQFDDGSYYGSSCAKKVGLVSDGLLKSAKIKSDYDIVAFNQNPRVQEIQAAWPTAPIAALKGLRAELKKIKENYRRAA